MSLGFYPQEEVCSRRKELVEALYSGSLENARAIAEKYNISFFVIESYTYDRPFIDSLGSSRFAEDRQVYHSAGQAGAAAGFALLEFAKNNYDIKINGAEGDIFIVRTAKLSRG